MWLAARNGDHSGGAYLPEVEEELEGVLHQHPYTVCGCNLHVSTHAQNHPHTRTETLKINAPATMPMVVGSDAAHTPSRFSVRSSMPEATTSGGKHSKQAVRGMAFVQDVRASPRSRSAIPTRPTPPLEPNAPRPHPPYNHLSPVRPGSSVWMWPETASSDTPDSIHGRPSSLQAWFTAVRAP